jgi:hypothetical protein
MSSFGMASGPMDALQNLTFNDVQTDLSSALEGFDKLHEFVDKYGFFVPQEYKDDLDKFQKYVTALENFLKKTP